jgi:lysozyme family protein
MTHEEIITFVIDVFEGGSKYTDAPGDHGGATKYGITRTFLARAWGKPISKLDIKNLTLQQAIDAYRLVLLVQAGLRSIEDWRVLLVVYDFAVNAGADDAIPALQRAVGAQPDGRLGPDTLNKLNAIGQAGSYTCRNAAANVLAQRQAFHIARSYAPQQQQWVRGWLNRCTKLLAVTTAMAETEAQTLRKRAAAGMIKPGEYASAFDRVKFERRRKHTIMAARAIGKRLARKRKR